MAPGSAVVNGLRWELSTLGPAALALSRTRSRAMGMLEVPLRFQFQAPVIRRRPITKRPTSTASRRSEREGDSHGHREPPAPAMIRGDAT